MDTLKVSMDPSLRRGIDLFNAHEYFECHEVLEDVWLGETGPRKLFLQSIIHLAVAYHHLGRGNLVGGVRQLRRAVRKLERYLPTYEGVDTGALLRHAFDTIDHVRRGAPIQYPRIVSCDS